MNFKARTLKKNSFIFGFGRGAQVGKASFLEVNLRRKRRRWAYHFYLVRFRPWDPTNPRFWKKTEHFFLTMRSKIVRRLPSWQRSGVLSQQRLRLRRLTLVKRIHKLRFESVSFLFLVCFSIFLSRMTLINFNYSADHKKKTILGMRLKNFNGFLLSGNTILKKAAKKFTYSKKKVKRT